MGVILIQKVAVPKYRHLNNAASY